MDAPKHYRAVMLSSTFTDLAQHRQRAIEAISKLGYVPEVMEHPGARAETDVIDTPLEIGPRRRRLCRRDWTKIWADAVRRKTESDPASITELEFDEAMRPIERSLAAARAFGLSRSELTVGENDANAIRALQKARRCDRG